MRLYQGNRVLVISSAGLAHTHLAGNNRQDGNFGLIGAGQKCRSRHRKA